MATLAERFGGDDDEKLRELETMAAGLKAVGTWHATATIQECREACGGAGYLRANRFAALKADTDVFTTFEGDNTVLLQLVAKNLLTDFKAEFGELDALGTAAFFAGQVFETVAERSALRELLGRLGDDLLPGRDDEGDLLERETQLETVRWREEHVKQSLARRLQRGLDGDGDAFELLIDCQDHLVLAARAYVDRRGARGVRRRGRARARGRAARAARTACATSTRCTLFERERGWFQEHGRFSSTRSKAIIKAVNAACAELAPHAGCWSTPSACRRPRSARWPVSADHPWMASALWAESETIGRATHVAGHLVRGRSALANGHDGETPRESADTGSAAGVSAAVERGA